MFQNYRKNNPIVGDDGKWIMDPAKVAEPAVANKIMVESILFGTAETIGIICEYRDLLKQVNTCKEAYSYDIEEEPLVPPPSEQDEEEEDQEFLFHPKHVAMMLEKLNQMAKLNMISLPTFIFMVEDLIALSKGAPENRAYLPNPWLGLNHSQIAKLGTSLMAQKEIINWKNFLISCMDISMPFQEDILDMLFQFRTLDPDLTNCLDKNKFDLTTLWFEPMDSATIAQDTSFLLWRECVYQLFCDRFNLFQYIEFLLYFSKNSDPRIGLANSLALLTGNFISIDQLPSEGDYGATDLPVTDSELEILFAEEDLLLEGDEPVGMSDLYHPKGQKLNLTRRMTMLRDRRNQLAVLEYGGEYLGGQIQGYKAPPSTRMGSRKSEVTKMTDDLEAQSDAEKSEPTQEENEEESDTKSRKTRTSTAPRRSSSKKSKHKKKMDSKSGKKVKSIDAGKSESVEKLASDEKKEKKLLKKKRSKSRKGDRPDSLYVEEEEEEETEEEMDEYWEEEEDYQEEKMQNVSAIGLRLIPLESFLQALWFGHITAYPIKNQSFLSLGFNKLKDLVQSVYEEIYIRDASELADPNAVELSALLKHPFVRELLKRYKGFEKIEITAKVKEVLNMPSEELEEEPKSESEIDSLPSTSPSVEFPLIPQSPTSTSTFNDSFSRIFSCLSLQRECSDASIQSGPLKATSLKPYTLTINEKEEVAGEMDDDIFLHYKPGGVSPTCSYADVVQMEVPVIDIMRASGLPSPRSFPHLEDNGSEEEEEEESVEILQYRGSFEMELEMDGEREVIGEDGDYLRRKLKKTTKIQANVGSGSSAESLGTKFRPIRERESEILRRKEFSPFNFGMDPKLSSMLWKM